MEAEETTARESQTEKPPHRKRKWRYVVVLSVLAAVIALLFLGLPNGASYEEYLQLKKGMSKKQVAGIIGEADYWHHYEGDLDVTSWVNKDGTYIRAVFDKKTDVLLEVSWKSGWNPSWQKEEE